MRVRKCSPAGTIHLHGRQVDCSDDQRRARRPKGDRLGQTRVATPPGDFGQVECPSSLMDCRKRRRPAARPAEPTFRMGRVRTRLVLAESNGHIDATTGEPSYGDRSIESHPACGEVAARRQPQGQTVNPSARPPVTHVWKGQVPSNLVPVLAKPVAMQNRRRFAMNLWCWLRTASLNNAVTAEMRRPVTAAPRRSHATTSPLSTGLDDRGERYRIPCRSAGNCSRVTEAPREHHSSYIRSSTWTSPSSVTSITSSPCCRSGMKASSLVAGIRVVTRTRTGESEAPR